MGGYRLGRRVGGAPPEVQIRKPMPPPAWALAERALLTAYSEAAEFAAKYIDERGYFRGHRQRRSRTT
jgi:hypothetical protein